MAEDPFQQRLAKIDGDLSAAVTAQVNRWAKPIGFPEFPLVSGTLNPAVAGFAFSLLQQRLAGTLATSLDPVVVQEIVALQSTKDIYNYVQTHREIVVQTLALYGDHLGLPPAKVGITGKKIPTWFFVVAIGGGLLALGSLAAFTVKRKGQNKSLPAGA
jgi:hypothetical protein